MTRSSLAMLLLSAAALSACTVTQPPAQVVMKGQNFYGTQGAPAQVAAAPAYQPRQVASVPAAPSQPMQVASAPAIRETAKLGDVAVKELAPLGPVASKPAPQPVLAQAPVASAPAAQSIDVAAAEELARQVALEAEAEMNTKPQLPEPQARVVADNSIPPAASSAPASVASKGLIWPVKGKVISAFGPRAGGEYNDGINIAAMQGEPIVAAADGEVVYSGNELKGYGNMVILRHDNGLMTAYAHADRILVSKGEQVKQGVTIATVGKSGGVDQAQLHFGVRKDKQPVDPMTMLGQNNFAAR